MKIKFQKPAVPETGAVVVGIWQNNELSSGAERINDITNGLLEEAISADSFKGKKDETITLLSPRNIKAKRIVCMGLGKKKDANAISLQKLGANIFVALNKKGTEEVNILSEGLNGEGELDDAQTDVSIAEGFLLRSHKFDKYLSAPKEEEIKIKSCNILTEDFKEAEKAFDTREKVAEGVFLTRELVSEPANILYPESFTERAKELEKLGVEIKILNREQMKEQGMEMLLGVAQGSVKEPRTVIMSWNGADDKSAAPISFIGKGVCFDSGGISIKPSKSMEEMKGDMGGAGVVTGLMKALAARRAKVNVVAAIGLVENMPSGNAIRPGDILKSMSGKTVEVINTDAEGRLVLGDVMWYVQENYKPSVIIDLATLTGAILVALGTEKAGLFSNDEDLQNKIIEAGLAVDEPVWAMPLGEEYDKQLKSNVADMKNIGGRDAGSITAAQFLKRFIKDEEATKWAHLDIAGVTWTDKPKFLAETWGTGFGVRLLDRLVADNFEDK